MATVSKALLARRFVQTVRAEGTKSALRRTGGYLGRKGWHWLPLWMRARRPAVNGTYLHGMWRALAQENAFHVTVAPAVLHRRRQIALIGDLNLPQCRKYRVEQLARFWEARGVTVEYAHYEDAPRASRIMQYATHLMEYRLPATTLTDMLRYEARRLRLPVLYDLDDPLFSVSAYETYGNMAALDPAMKAHFVAQAPTYLNMMNGADVISVSTPGMAAHAGQLTARPIHLRRNFADHETLQAGKQAQAARQPDGLFRACFSSGSRGHEADLALIMEPLTEFILGGPDRRLMILGHFNLRLLPKALARKTQVVRFTDYPRYLGALALADVALMPLCDDPFNRCKSAVRVLDAAAVGVPSIVSAVGDLPFVVQPEVTGYVAGGAGDWRDQLNTLAANKAGRARMGIVARADLEARWQGSDAAHIVAPELLRWVEG